MASMPPVEGSAAHGELDLYAGVGPEGFAHENVQVSREITKPL